uniref:Uncharacterized protein n=1 Tax=Odontella aurita TaxID=265563 RepID=A0A7S4KBF7_9STRA|mmetsp:Transcript_830/g.2378  ORF Transcript_830/g.2378 Transcript_830/m.2378 type:complete len:264 (+) Transcript_830:124-915(+)
MLPITVIDTDEDDGKNTTEPIKETSNTSDGNKIESANTGLDEGRSRIIEKELGDSSLDQNKEDEEGSDDEGSDDEGEDGKDTPKEEEDPQEEGVSQTRSETKPPREFGRIFKAVHKMLKGAGTKYFVDPDRDMIRMSATGKHATYNAIFDAREQKEQLFVYVCCPNMAPVDRRLPAAEFITRANWGLAIGNFEMDMNDGEVRYKVSIDVEEGEISCKMVQNMLGASTQTMERYFPGLMSVYYADKDAASAVSTVEGEVRFISQ